MSEQYLSDGYLFHAPDYAKEEFMVFSLFVAGKGADRTWDVVKHFLSFYEIDSPFKTISRMISNDSLDFYLRKAKTGRYTTFNKGLPDLITLDVNDCTIEELESVKGVGKKTSRFYKLYTDRDFIGIPLDTHLLKFLRLLGYDAPKSTPQSTKRYTELENILIDVWRDSKPYIGLDTLQDFDYFIWEWYYKGDTEDELKRIFELWTNHKE